MLTHIVVFFWKPDAPAELVEAVPGHFDAVLAQVDVVLEARHGRDLALRPETGGDYGLVLTFRDRDDWQAYQDHPAHKRLVKEVIGPLQARRVTCQFDTREPPR